MVNTEATVARVVALLRRASKVYFYLWLFDRLRKTLLVVRDGAVLRTLRDAAQRLLRYVLAVVKSVPMVRAKIEGELAPIVADAEKKFVQPIAGRPCDALVALPERGMADDEFTAHLEALAGKKAWDWKAGMVSAAVFANMPAVTKRADDAYLMFSKANALHPDLFPGPRQMEAEIVAMTLRLYHGVEPAGYVRTPDEDSLDGQSYCGNLTSGGTESICMAMKAYREWGRAVRHRTLAFDPFTVPLHPLTDDPDDFPLEIVAPVTTHPAHDKACHYYGMRLVHVPVDAKTGRVRVQDIEAAITSRTVAISASAPCFSFGAVDPIESLAKLARKYRIGLHVDACLGSFVLPFLERAGLPRTGHCADFRVRGVTSISCDAHKYGFCPKGCSVVMFASHALRHHMYYVQPDWPGGIYASPTAAGTRPGAIIAGSWATMVSLGVDGYVDAVRKVQSTFLDVLKGMRGLAADSGLFEIAGEPELCTVSVLSKKIDIYRFNDGMMERGWRLSCGQFPPTVGLACTHLTDGAKYLKDATEVMLDIQRSGNFGTPSEKSGRIYGTSQGIPDRSIVDALCRRVIDTWTKAN